MDYFTTDPHWEHNRPFIFEERGFTNIVDHDRAILEAINTTVDSIKDTLWILGDVSWGNSLTWLKQIRCSRINVIPGNHDRGKLVGRIPSWVHICNLYENIEIEKQKVTLCHFPMLSWEKSHVSSWLLYGHLHGRELPIKGKAFDVCPKKDHIQPYSWEEIKTIMAGLPDNWDKVTR